MCVAHHIIKTNVSRDTTYTFAIWIHYTHVSMEWMDIFIYLSMVICSNNELYLFDGMGLSSILYCISLIFAHHF